MKREEKNNQTNDDDDRQRVFKSCTEQMKSTQKKMSILLEKVCTSHRIWWHERTTETTRYARKFAHMLCFAMPYPHSQHTNFLFFKRTKYI